MTNQTKYVKKGSKKAKVLDEITGVNQKEYYLVEIEIEGEQAMRYWLKSECTIIDPPKK